jgi:hypothetical protein
VRGFVHILRQSEASGTFSYAVIFAPVGPTDTGGAVPSKNLHGKDDLVDFLKKQMDIPEDRIRDAVQDLETNGNASIAFVDLREDKLRNLCLIP